MAEENTGGRDQITREGGVARSRKQRSAMWEHFTLVTTADGKDGAQCKYCSAVLAADTQTHGTGSMWTHYRRHRTRGEIPREVAVARRRARLPPPREAASESSNLKPGYKEACEDLARMIALRGYDSSIVEDDYFRSFVGRFDPAFEVPSRRTTEEMCDRLFDEARRDLSSKLKRTTGRVSIAIHEAKTIEGAVLCSACHFIDDKWNLREKIMDASMVAHRRDIRGPLLGTPELDPEVHDCGMDSLYILDLVDEHKVFSISWGKVGDHLPQDTSLEYEFSDRYPVKRQLIYTCMDNVLHSIAQCLLDIVRRDGFTDPIFNQIWALKLTRQQREEHLLQISLPDLWTYNERWYAYYCSLEVVQNVRSSTREVDGDTLRFIGEQESEFARLLRKLWGTIYRAIQTISATNRPTSNLCLRELFKVREALESKLEGDSIDEANVDHEIRIFIDHKGVPDVLSKARDTLDRCIQESYLVWSIPLVLDPRYKLSYIESNFNNAFESGAAAYIKEVKTKIKEIFSDYNQADKQTSSGDSNCLPSTSVDSTYSLERFFPEQESKQQYDESNLQKFMEKMEIELKSELDRYLEEDRVLETDDFNILKWWKDHSSTYPTVARMARDALAMPTCSNLSSELMSHIRSRVRGYSEVPYGDELSEEEE